jgi:hypothetical protein
MDDYSYVFRVEQITIVQQRSSSNDTDVLSIFIEVGDDYKYAYVLPLGGHYTSGNQIPLGHIAQTIPIGISPPDAPLTLTTIITNVNKPSADPNAQFYKFLETAGTVLKGIAAGATIVGVPEVGAVASIAGSIASSFDSVATELGLINPASPDCTGRVFTNTQSFPSCPGRTTPFSGSGLISVASGCDLVAQRGK